MSLPGIPNIPPASTITRDDAINLLLQSIALQELSLSRILNAEGEKIQYVLGTPPGIAGPASIAGSAGFAGPAGFAAPVPTVSINDILAVNQSVKATMDNVIKTEFLLLSKLETVLSAPVMPYLSSPTGPADGTLGATDTAWGLDNAGAADADSPTGAAGNSEEEADASWDMEASSKASGLVRTSSAAGWTEAARSAESVITGIHGFAANTAGPVIAVVLGGTSIPLPSNQALSGGVTINGASTVITLPAAGTYLFSYQINLTAALAAGSQLLINGAAFTPSILKPALPLSSFNNTVITSVGAGASVQLQLFGLFGSATLLGGAAGAALTIVRIA